MDDFEVTTVNSVDTVFEWQSEGDSGLNQCRIRIFWLTWEKAIVIVKNINYNCDRSVDSGHTDKLHNDNAPSDITTATAEIVRFASNFYNLVPSKMMLVEYYPGKNSDLDIYFHVLLSKDKTVRSEIAKSQLLKLIEKSA